MHRAGVRHIAQGVQRIFIDGDRLGIPVQATERVRQRGQHAGCVGGVIVPVEQGDRLAQAIHGVG